MPFFILKVFVSALIIAGASELAKRSAYWGAFLIALPTASILSMIWIYIETKDIEKIAEMSWSILWLVLLTLPFFMMIPFLLRKGFSFSIAMVLSCLLTVGLYLCALKFMNRQT